MKKLFILSSIIILNLITNATAATPQTTMSLIVKTNNNQTFDLSKEQGKLTVVTFWASWCNICRAELDALNKLYKNQNNKNKFEVIAINFDEQDEPADEKRFLKILNPAFKIAYFHDITTNNFPRVTGLPTTYIINKNGKIKEEVEVDEIENIPSIFAKALNQ